MRLPPRSRAYDLELLLLLEEHSEGYDGSVDEETADDGHYHGWDGDNCGVCKYCGQCCRWQLAKYSSPNSANASHRSSPGPLPPAAIHPPQSTQHSSPKPYKRDPNSPIPITTSPPVTNFPKSKIALPPPSAPKSSGFAHREHIQFGRGAIT